MLENSKSNLVEIRNPKMKIQTVNFFGILISTRLQ